MFTPYCCPDSTHEHPVYNRLSDNKDGQSHISNVVLGLAEPTDELVGGLKESKLQLEMLFLTWT